MTRRDSGGFTLIELLIVVAMIAIIAAITVPGLLRARISGNEASAIGSLRAIKSGESTYSMSCASGGYAQTLADLASPATGAGAGFISPDMAFDPTNKSGYLVALAPNTGASVVTLASATCNGSTNNAVSSFYTEAHPVTVGSTGQRSFGTDTRGTIYFDNTGVTVPAGMAGLSPLQ